jgi:hypothetical protein
MKWIWHASEFVRRVHCQLRFGERSRAPLKLIRLELRGEYAECEWMARAKDLWDTDLPIEVQEENETFQALRDALAVREFLFCSFPKLDQATLRVYRQTEAKACELIITGTVRREDQPPVRSGSLFMQARLVAFDSV